MVITPLRNQNHMEEDSTYRSVYLKTLICGWRYEHAKHITMHVVPNICFLVCRVWSCREVVGKLLSTPPSVFTGHGSTDRVPEQKVRIRKLHQDFLFELQRYINVYHYYYYYYFVGPLILRCWNKVCHCCTNEIF